MVEGFEYPRGTQFSYEDGWNWLKDYCEKNWDKWLSTNAICQAMKDAEMAKMPKSQRDYVFEMPLKEATELVGSLTVNDLEELDNYKTLGGLRGYVQMFKEKEEDGYNYLSLRANGLWCFKNANTGEHSLLSETKFYNILRKKYEEKHPAVAQCEEIEDEDTKVFSLSAYKNFLERLEEQGFALRARNLESFLRQGYDTLLWKDDEWYVAGKDLTTLHLCRDSDCFPATTRALDYVKNNHLMPYFWED